MHRTQKSRIPLAVMLFFFVIQAKDTKKKNGFWVHVHVDFFLIRVKLFCPKKQEIHGFSLPQKSYKSNLLYHGEGFFSGIAHWRDI